MPSEKILDQKKQIVADLAQTFRSSSAGVLVDYKGISVAEDTKLRAELRGAGVQYTVVKNTLTRLAVKEAGLDGLAGVLEGTTALAVSNDDPVAPAKILSAYAAKNKSFSIKAGFVEGRPISADEVKNLAKLPPKEELIARALAGFNAPVTGFVNVLSANLRGLVVALNAIAEKKGA